MLIEVIPFDISIDDNGLSYFIKDELIDQINIGSIIEIPFKSMIIFGIIGKINIENKTGEDIKSVISIIYSIPILSEYQIKMIYEISNKYFITIHKVLSLFLPKFIYKNLEKKSFIDIKSIPKEKKSLGNKVLYYCNNIDIFEKIIELIDENKGTAIIFPTDFMIDDFLKKNPIYKTESIIYKNNLSYSKKYKTFIETYNKTKNIIIGTRKILVYNLEAYKKIIYVEDIFVKYLYSYSHKYVNISLLENLYRLGNFEINILSKIPSLNLMYKVGQKEYKLVNT